MLNILSKLEIQNNKKSTTQRIPRCILYLHSSKIASYINGNVITVKVYIFENTASYVASYVCS